MKKIILTSALFCLFLSLSWAQKTVTIEGTVKDENNVPLPYVNVFLLDTPDGGMTDDAGAFSFKTSLKEKEILTATMVGYQKYTKEIAPGNSTVVTVDIILHQAAVELDEAIITASSYGSEKEKGLVISRLDVLTTPGGATDIYQSLKTMPGITQVSESAELYVRGGDPLETITLINQSVIYHPFTFESAYGGIFSNIDQSNMKSMYFTSGGFSAKYGNVLSGVLDIETKNQPSGTQTNLGLSLAGGSITSSIAFNQDAGIYFDARQNFTRPIFWFNGGGDRLTVSPVSKNFSGGMIYNYSGTGRFKFFTILADDKQGVKVERAEYNGEFNGNTKNTFYNLQHTDILPADIIVKSSAAYNKYSNEWLFGALNIVKTDFIYSFRTDLEKSYSSFKILAGGEFENRKVKYEGTVPAEDYDISPSAEKKVIDAELHGAHYGVYTELQAGNLFAVKTLSLTAGIRHDEFLKLGLNWTDPRIGIGYKIGEHSTLRGAWGLFRQIPDPRLFNPVDGNPGLKAMQAEHWIISYDYEIDQNNSFRVELYKKDYKNLPKENELTNYDNSGRGFANGIDMIYKGQFPFGIDGWVSYGYINTKRNWMDFDAMTSSSFDITHNIALVLKYNFLENFQLGLTAKYSTGRPYTPPDSSIFHENSGIYEPVYAPTNSSRFQDYKRIDLRLTYFSQLFGSYSLVAFIEGINIFDFTNIFGYSYSPDYSQKKEIKSYFGQRMLVFGFTVGF